MWWADPPFEPIGVGVTGDGRRARVIRQAPRGRL